MEGKKEGWKILRGVNFFSGSSLLPSDLAADFMSHGTRGWDEVIGKSSIWLKLYLVKLLNISRKVSKRVLQNMNKEKKI